MGDLVNLDEQRKLRRKAAPVVPIDAAIEPQALETFLAGAFVAAFPGPKLPEDPEC